MLPLLNARSYFSFLQAVPSPAELVEAAASLGCRELALTDVNSLHGAVEFVTAAHKAGVRPLLGAAVDCAGQGRLSLLLKRGGEPAPLVTAVNRASLAGEAPLSCLAGGKLLVLAGEESAIYRCLAGGDYPRALALARELKDLAGADFWLGLAGNRALWAAIGELARAVGAGVAACPPVRWVQPKQELAYRALTAIAGLAGSPGAGLPARPAELEKLYSVFPEAVAGARTLAEQAGGELPLGKFFLPRFGQDDAAFLRSLCRRGLERRYSRDRGEAEARLAMELEVIEAMGFSSYFLICWDLVRFARSQGIAVGPGRGSAGGSIVSYLLDITRVDPLAHNLYFERFLNPGRVSMPDIDMDFCYRRRDEVFAYAVQRYGREHTCQIAAYSTFGPRGSLRDAGRALGFPKGEVDALCRRVPSHGRLAAILQQDPQLAAQAARPPWRRWFALAAQLEGRVRHTSVHPGGLLITPFPLNQLVPLFRSSGGDVCSQWDKDGVEAMGLLKMDLLAVRGLTVNQQVTLQVGRARVARRYSPRDPAALRLLQRGETLGCFQLESEGMRALMKRLRPRGVEDVIALLSLYRPGPWQAGMVERYIRRRHGLEPVEYWHPDLEPVLRDTYGVLLYQEQVMQVAQVIAGYSPAEADMLRRAVAKLRRGEMQELTREFCTRARQRGYTGELARQLLDILIEFSGYAFNRAHSAAYGHLAMFTVFLKARWPAHFCAALLATRMGYYPPQTYVNEAIRLGIPVLPPCVNKSGLGTRVEGKAIRLGLDYVRGLGADAARLIQARGKTPFSCLRDFVVRAQLGEAALRALVQAGALDCLEPNRRKLLAALPVLAAVRPGPPDLVGQLRETGPLLLPDLPDLNPARKAAGMFASLGLVLDPDWLAAQRPPWDLPRVTAADVAALPRGRQVVVAAAVVNRRYGNITLDDFSAQVQARYPGPIPAFWVWARGRAEAGRLVDAELRPLEGVLTR
ncbi:MAG TPA: DNA polymerase III subunit alpha [Bacillota bacterium]|nr:DNA polymerase III subunit alpha [Bacillota bacterium]HPZ90383.1 DNA polymerase III subunit alpha [Bacillota bacterium]HQE02481.1 DNA polymerase III subunit alpha [Bacillota bacterium]